ncbi:hypothetical protein AB0J86_18535 [Micromonospora sp. NPDC049559]|uniref:hypothetical protein n=1 Tax=Micromonospora sp. NPDC049559 TaxID=3155923 RepID=UPI003443679E
MDFKVWMYLCYLLISIGLTIWVARTLSRNGLVFLADVFADGQLARAVNSLLVVGFYLLNLGYVTVAMKYDGGLSSTSQTMEELSKKIGLVLLVLGALHFFNVFALGRYRRGRLRQNSARPPVAPSGLLPAMPRPMPVGAYGAPPDGTLPQQPAPGPVPPRPTGPDAPPPAP